MNSFLSAFITGSILSWIFPMPPVRIDNIEGPIWTEPLIIAFVVIILAVILIPTFSVTRKMQFHHNPNKHIYGFDPSK